MKTAGTMGIIIDRRVDEGKHLAFFGESKDTGTMPAKVALRFDCDLVPAQVERIKGARFWDLFSPPVRPGNPKGEQAIDITRQVDQICETWIRKNPADWFCATRLWPKIKPGVA
jgi:KDO2-lipid IV(A) lauroyltransferase